MSEKPDPKIRIDTSAWSRTTRTGYISPDLRRAQEVILYAIAGTESLRESLYLKGGVLMSAYGSPRKTTDIDFSYAPFGNPDNNTADNLKSVFDNAMKRTATRLGFADLLIRVQSIRTQPKDYPTGMAPALKFKIAYANRGTGQERRLNKGEATDVVPLDISFKERIGEHQELQLSDEESLLAYSLVDLVAEKYRALLQQTVRNRNRRQDVYDLNFLLRHYDLEYLKLNIFETFIEKCESRELPASRNSIDGQKGLAHA